MQSTPPLHRHKWYSEKLNLYIEKDLCYPFIEYQSKLIKSIKTLFDSQFLIRSQPKTRLFFITHLPSS